MQLAEIILTSLSFIVLGVLFARTIWRWRLAGAFPFMVQIIFVAVWSVGSVFEMAISDLPGKLFWRNVQQIGVFFAPVSCLVFAVQFSRLNSWSRWLPLFWLVPVASVLLSFTDQSHHMTRSLVEMVDADGILRIENTTAGMLLISYSFAMATLSMIILGRYAAKSSQRVRVQTVFVIASIFLATFVSFANLVWLRYSGLNIPIVALYLPSCMILFYSLFRHKLFLVSPIARDKIFDVLDQGIIVTDDQGTVVDRNPHSMLLLEAFFGSGAEINGKALSEVFSQYPEWVRLVTNGLSGQFEAQSPRKDTGMLFIRIKVYPLRSERGKLIGMVSLLRDITARRLQERELQSKADTDSLTGLLNRNGFLQLFHKTLDSARTTDSPVSVLMIDLDRLKHINDTYGHFSGDRALLAIAGVLQRSLRQQDIVGRIGGDEFAVVLPGICGRDAAVIADRIRCETGLTEVVMENGEIISVTLSIGICDNYVPGGEAERLLNLADKAMYMAKKKSRDCCVAWEHNADLAMNKDMAVG